MPLQGPLIVIAENPAPALASALGAAGAFPVIEAKSSDAAAAINAAKPSAIVLAEANLADDPALAQMLTQRVTNITPIIPVIACVETGQKARYPEALPVAANAAPRMISARLSTALRVRRRHATVLRRAANVQEQGHELPIVPQQDPLDEAIVIVAGRGRNYPKLAVSVGERLGLIGALSIETAARYLRARDVDGLIIGDGFAAHNVEALLTVLSEDPRFRDLPVATLGEPDVTWQEELPTLIQSADPDDLVTRFLPFVRLRAFDARLQRIASSFDLKGMIDPGTGLLRPDAFVNDLRRVMRESSERGVSLSIARFALPSFLDLRGELDAARLVSRLIRNVDFACREEDGSILIAFTETDLRHAHIVARRLAAVLKHTMLRPDINQPVAPEVTLATRKSGDDVASLLARVMTHTIAAE